MNHQIKRALFKYYALISITGFGAAVVLFIGQVLSWQQFAGVAAGVFAFGFAVQKQNLEDIRLFKDLFEQFNKRYDRLDKELNRIYPDDQPLGKQFTDDERDTLYKYFNLCGEEYLYFEKGHIGEEVWCTWKKGMEFYRGNERIKLLWDRDLATNWYYGLSF